MHVYLEVRSVLVNGAYSQVRVDWIVVQVTFPFFGSRLKDIRFHSFLATCSLFNI